MIDPTEDARVGDLVAVQMQNRQDRTIANGIQELVDMPTGGQGSGFRFTIAHAGDGDQLRVVKNRSARMGEDIAELSALMDRTRHLSCAVTADMSWKRKHLEKLSQPFCID